MTQRGRYEYTTETWSTRDELVSQLTEYTNKEWLVDHHIISKDHDGSGWTIYRRYVNTHQPLLERIIGVGELYSIVNKVLEPGSDKNREFSAAIKFAVRQEGDQ